MEKLKKWLETGLTVILALIGLMILTPIYVVVLCANTAFIGARIVGNIVAAMTAISAIGYACYAVQNNIGFNADGGAVLLVTITLIIAVGLWDVVAWALWRWKPDWLDALLPDENDDPPLPLPKKFDGWLEKLDWRADIACYAVGTLLVFGIAAFPFVLGMDGMGIALDGAFGFGIAFTVGALAWPVVVLIGWLPRCRKRKFDEFFCAATRNCQVVIFGKVLEDDRKQDATNKGAKPE